MQQRARGNAEEIVRVLIRQFVADEDGQDLIEYALLAAFIGLTGAAAWTAIRGGIGSFYVSSNGVVNDLWESPNP